MFDNLNPLDRSTAILEIVIMLLGAALIGFLVAWMARRPRKVAAVSDDQQQAATSKAKGQVSGGDGKSKEAARIMQLEKELDAVKTEKAALEKAVQVKVQQAREREDGLRKEVEGLKAELAGAKELAAKGEGAANGDASGKGGKEVNAMALENAKKQVADLEKALERHKARIRELELQKGVAVHPVVQQGPSEAEMALRKEVEALKAELAGAKEKAGQLEAKGPSEAEVALRKEVEVLKAEMESLERNSREQLAAAKANQQPVVAESDRIRELEHKLRDQQREVFNLQAELAKLKSSKPGAGTAAGPDSKEMDWLKREKEDLERDVKDLEAQIDRLEKENGELRTAARDKSAAGPALDKLTKERDKLKAELEKLKKGIAESLPSVTADFSHLGVATEAEKDDLTRINGIGPVVEQKLNQLGIFTYGQVSKLTAADMELIDQVLQLFPGRVARENWVGQAGALARI